MRGRDPNGCQGVRTPTRCDFAGRGLRSGAVSKSQGFDPVQQGVSLALEAHRRGFVDDRALDVILQYYDAEGAVEPAAPQEVLARIGGVTDQQLRVLAGEPARTPSDVQGQRFGDRLTLLEPLGEGGMGTVYRAYDRVLKRAVAVKRLRVDHLDKAGTGRLLARFEREAMAMARVRHPACVQIFDAGLTAKGEPYLVMELVTGKSLRDVIEERHEGGHASRRAKRLDPRQVAAWGAAIAEALQACHDVGLVHRDVKPANVLLDVEGHPRLTDFGVALDDKARTKLTVDKAMVGTLAYMSPEQALGEAVDARSDVYALGATLYELLTGRAVFEAAAALVLMRQVLSVEPLPPRKLDPRLPRDLETIVLTCLSKAVGDRYATAQALALDLRRFLADEPVLARRVSVAGRLVRRAWRARRLVSAGLVVALAAGAAWGVARVRAREAQWARIDAALSAAAVTSDLAAAEQELLPLVAIAEPEQAERARQALRTLRGRRSLAEAEAAFTRWREAVARGGELLVEIDALRERIDPQQPYAESPDKRRLFELEDEHALEVERAAGELFEIERTLGRAALDSSGAEVDALRARVLLARGRELEDDDPGAAEKLFAQAERLDAVSGGALAEELQHPVVEVRSTPPGRFTLSRYSFDPALGRMTPTVVAEGVGSATLRPEGAGDYLVEFAADGHLGARDVLQLARGEQRSVEVELVPLEELGPLADQVVLIPQGEARWGERLEKRATVPAFLMMKDEVTYEMWHSFLVAERPGPEFEPYVMLNAEGNPNLPAERRKDWPASGVNLAEMKRFLAWLQAELDLAGVGMQVRFPSPEQWFRSARGELGWLYPWGRRFDAAHCSSNEGVRASDMTLERLFLSPSGDVSAFGVRQLTGRVSEVVEDRDSRFNFRVVGSTLASSRPQIDMSLVAASGFHSQSQSAVSGFRLALDWRESTAAARDEMDGQRLFRAGCAHGEAMNFDEALRLLTSALKVLPDRADIWVSRGWVRAQLDDHWGALWDTSKALQLRPGDTAILNNMAGAHLSRGTLTEALHYITAAIDADPTRGEFRAVRSRIWLRQGEYAKAEDELRVAVRLSPEHPVVLETARRVRERRD